MLLKEEENLIPLDKSHGTVVDGLGRESMGPGYREVEDVPGLSKPKEQPLSLDGAQKELRVTLAKDVPTQDRSTLVENRNLRVEVNPICDPV